MPQMMPLNWMLMMIMFSMMLYLIMIMMYFFFKKNTPYTNLNLHPKNNKFNMKW